MTSAPNASGIRPDIRFAVQASAVDAHLFDVELHIAQPAAQQLLSLPVWIPGSYLVREFSKNLQRLTAQQGRRAVPLAQLDKHRWQIDCVAGKPLTVTMGCYGIGVTRVVASAIEQNFDDKGIIWPAAIAPFEVAIVPMNAHKSPRTLEAAEALYAELAAAGYDVLLDDRNERPGVKFSDLELTGIPHRIVIGEKGLDAGTFEYKGRRDAESVNISKEELLAKIAK